jgi:hypothetical protein
MKKYWFWFFLLLAALAAGSVIFWQYLPSAAEYKLRQALTVYGIQATSLKVEKLNNREAVVTDIELESTGASPMHIGRLLVNYQLKQLWKGKLDRLEAEGFSGSLYSSKGGWTLGGLENFHSAAAETEENNPLFDAAAIHGLFPNSVAISKGKLKVQTDHGNYTLPFRLDMALAPTPKLTLKTQDIAANAKPYALKISPAILDATFDEASRQWKGKLDIASFKLSGLSLPLPPLKVKADYTLSSKNLLLQLHAVSRDKTYRSDITLTLPVARPLTGKMLVKHLEFPWGGGHIAVDALNLPLAMNKPIAVKIQLHEVQLATLLQEIGEDKVKAVGKISGMLPVTYHPNGQITLQQGVAEALEAGTLFVSPDLLPGDNAQLALARGTLENFHYTKLQIRVSSPDGKKSAIHLMLEGRNPNATDARPVKLNINLTGDILPLIQQSLLPFNDLKTLLHTQEKP